MAAVHRKSDWSTFVGKLLVHSTDMCLTCQPTVQFGDTVPTYISLEFSCLILQSLCSTRACSALMVMTVYLAVLVGPRSSAMGIRPVSAPRRIR